MDELSREFGHEAVKEANDLFDNIFQFEIFSNDFICSVGCFFEKYKNVELNFFVTLLATFYGIKISGNKKFLLQEVIKIYIKVNGISEFMEQNVKKGLSFLISDIRTLDFDKICEKYNKITSWIGVENFETYYNEVRNDFIIDIEN